MHQSGHLAPALGLYRYHEPAAPQGDDRLLEIFLISRGMDHMIQLFPNPE